MLLYISNVDVDAHEDEQTSDGDEFASHSFTRYYNCVKQPSQKSGRKVPMILVDMRNNTCVKH
jgi:hypothetical protein